MHDRYLEITYRKGNRLAAYLYLSRNVGIKCAKSQKLEDGLIVDFDQHGHAIGIEITSPKSITINQINNALESLALTPLNKNELLPLKAA
jgi:uncharacterized protein YuzE